MASASRSPLINCRSAHAVDNHRFRRAISYVNAGRFRVKTEAERRQKQEQEAVTRPSDCLGLHRNGDVRCCRSLLHAQSKVLSRRKIPCKTTGCATNSLDGLIIVGHCSVEVALNKLELSNPRNRPACRRGGSVGATSDRSCATKESFGPNMLQDSLEFRDPFPRWKRGWFLRTRCLLCAILSRWSCAQPIRSGLRYRPS
jgi:hypothetical protein